MADDWGNDPLKQGTPPSLPTVNVTATPDWGNDPVNQGAPPAGAPPHRTGFLDAAGTRVMDTLYGTAQLVSHLNPLADPAETARFDADLKKRREQIERERSVPSATVTETTLDDQGRATHSRPLAERGNPAATLGELTGDVVNPLNYAAPGRALGVATLARRVGSAALQGGLTAAEQPATHDGYWGEKTGQVTTGATAAGVLPAFGSAARAAKDYLLGWLSRIGKSPEDRAASKALQAIHARISKDIKGGGPTAQEMLDFLSLTPAKPLALMDVGGAGVVGLTGKVIRQPGAARQTLTTALTDRDKAASDRLSADIDAGLASDGVKPSQAVQGLQQARSIAAKPLWDKAMAGGSIAPLKQQFQDAYVEVGRAEKEAQRQVAEAQQAITIATAKQHRAGNDVYLVNSANHDLRAAQVQLQQAQGELAHQSEVRQLVLGMVKDAQADIDANAPGAVWSPRLQQFLNQPEIRSGLQTGIKLTRQKAVADGVPMNIGEYAIKGYDANGDAIVGKVPTMKLLASAKEGLDAELDKPQYHDELTGGLNKAGVHLDAMRRAFIEELDKLNPDYGPARAQWSGDTASMQAVRYGEKQWMNKRPEEIAADIDKMTPGDQEFARLGLAANLRKKMAQMGASGNEARAVAGDKEGAWLRQQIRPFFRSEDEYKTFINSIDAENRMFLRNFQIRGNSATAARQAEDFNADKVAHAAGFASGIANQHWLAAAYHGAKLKALGGIPDDVASQIAAMVSDPQKALEVLGGYRPKGPVRHYTPYVAGPAAAITANELGLQ
jgi:hypothetical protein